MREARDLFAAFREVQVRPKLAAGDLLLHRPSARYRSHLARAAWATHPPRWLVRRIGDRAGLALLIEAVK